MWLLYNVIGESAFADTRELLVDEIDEIIDHMNDYSLTGALEILYGRRVSFKSPVEYLLKFIQGLKQNNFFMFLRFMRELK